MHIEFDPVKNARNIAERGLSFEQAAQFDFETAKIWQDTRKTYPEARYLAMGYLGSRLHVLCFCHGLQSPLRIISFRKANQREGEKHGFPLTRY